ncbi:MAG: beta-ketoacyl synthase chain length factor, partial [Methylococcales bacterium]|nr:beta-ketoacyl synthase chain length factor [Methylococcales bacterium]
TPESWVEWSGLLADIPDEGLPDVSFLPSMFRRRCSRLSKFALSAIHGCYASDHPIPTVFASRHGELTRTSQLLDDIVQQQLLSPTAFSLSVHNTASGLYSISTKNTLPSSAISAGVDTLVMGLTEAYAQISTGEHSQVLLVVFDEPLTQTFTEFSDTPEKTFALCLLISNKSGGRTLTLTSQAKQVGITMKEPQGISLIRMLRAREQSVQTIPGGRFDWQWALSHA